MSIAEQELDSAIAATANQLRAHDAVLVVGAGLSLGAGFPLTSELEPLLYGALDADPEALDALRAELRAGGTAKNLVEDRAGDLDVVWRCIARRPVARAWFQRAFAALDRDRRAAFSPAHDAIAALLHRRRVELVVSLNWDTKLEGAYRARYGQRLRPDWLVKPHGDAADPAARWVLPSEGAAMPDELVERVSALAGQRPRLLLVVGYSEGDELVVERLTGPLADRWKVSRVGPSATGAIAVRASADLALPRIRAAAIPDPEARGWRYVNFEPAHDLTWAMSGRALGPLDAAVCPEAPEVERAVRELRATGAVVLAGPSGSGKSLTAFQAARVLWREGAEVVRLTDTNVSDVELRERLAALPRPLVAVIDDGQRLPEPILASFVEAAGSGLSVIAVVDSGGSRVSCASVHIDAERAVKTLAASLAELRAETLAAVRALDSRVGEGFLDEPLERRLAAAARSAKTPWQLMFVLSGGWNRLADRIHDLDRAGGADVLLGAIACEQLLSLDDALGEAQLRDLAARCGRPPSWVDEGLHQLRDRNLVLATDGVELPHRRFARRVFTLLLRASHRAEFLTAMVALLSSHRGSMIGVSWVLEDLRWASYDAGGHPGLVLDPETRDLVAARALEAQAGRERGGAAYVLNELRMMGRDLLADDAATLGRWIAAAQPAAMHGLARVVNDLSQDAPATLELLLVEVDPRGLMNAFAECSWSDAYAFGTLLDRLGNCSPAAFRAELSRHLDRDAALRLLGGWSDAGGPRLYDIDRVLGGLSAIDLDVALEGLNMAADAVAARWQLDFVEGWAELSDLQFVLGRPPAFLHPPRPSAKQRRVGRRLVEALDPATIARQISGSVERQWEPIGHAMELVDHASPRHARRIATLVDLDALDRATAGHWANRVRVFRGLTLALASSPDGEPAATWFARHVDEMTEIDDVTFWLIPEAAARCARALGRVIDLGHIETGLWAWVGEVLRRLIATDRDLAVRSVAARRKAFSASFTAASYAEHEPLDEVLDLLWNLDEALVRSLVAEVDAGQAREVWARRLRGKARERRAVARLVEIALTRGGPVGELAHELRRRYPRASVPLQSR